MSDGTRVYVARHNLRRYHRLLKSTVLDDKSRAVLEQLLKEAEAEVAVAEAEEQWHAAKYVRELPNVARHWHLNSEEFRTIADQAQNSLVKNTYSRLGDDYARLADAADARVTREQKSVR